jgi:hypothetical protein
LKEESKNVCDDAREDDAQSESSVFSMIENEDEAENEAEETELNVAKTSQANELECSNNDASITDMETGATSTGIDIPKPTYRSDFCPRYREFPMRSVYDQCFDMSFDEWYSRYP